LVRATGFQQPPENVYHTPYDIQVSDDDLLSISGPQTVDQTTGTTIGNELGHTVFGNWMQVAPGASGTATISYTLPFKIAIAQNEGVDWLNLWGKPSQEVDAYSLLIRKQSGKKNTIINSSVLLPEKYSIVWADSADPTHAGTTPHVFTYSNDLIFDTYYALLVGRKSNE
jgi:hypothetical protein